MVMNSDDSEEGRSLLDILLEMRVEVHATVPSQILAHERARRALFPEEVTTLCKAYHHAIIEWMLTTSGDMNQALNNGALKMVNAQNLGMAAVLDGTRLVGITRSPGEIAKIAVDPRLASREVAASRCPADRHVIYHRVGHADGERRAAELREAILSYRGYGRTDSQMAHVSRLLGYSEDNILDYLAVERLQQTKKRLGLLCPPVTVQGTEVYCDASVFSENPAVDDGRSQTPPTARIAVIIPSEDYGLVERLEADGAERPMLVNMAEERAIRRAREICCGRGIREYTIFSDSAPAIAQVGDPRVRWSSRWDGQLAGRLLDRVVTRVSYLRRTEGRDRLPESASQREITALFHAKRREFRLSESALWAELSNKATVTDARAREGLTR